MKVIVNAKPVQKIEVGDLVDFHGDYRLVANTGEKPKPIVLLDNNLQRMNAFRSLEELNKYSSYKLVAKADDLVLNTK